MNSGDTEDNSRESLAGGSAQVFGVSVIGPLHLKACLPCQDACEYRVLRSGAIVIAIADGLGSAKFSDTGAKLAVAAGIQCIEQALSEHPAGNRETIIRRAATASRDALCDHQRACGCELKDLACTLIVALFEDGRLSVVHIGDGAVVADLGGEYKTVSGPGDSEFANEVTPLTSSTWEKELRFTAADAGVRGVAVFSDGCQRAAFKKSEDGLTAFGGFFGPIFSFARELDSTEAGIRELEELLNSEKICHNSDDDKTLVIAISNATGGPHG